jgi:2-hydroxyacyl-CoA lyase 1
MNETTADYIAHLLRTLGVKRMYGVVGIPVVNFAESCRNQGIQFLAFRNEQSAAYAASIDGYLNAYPGVLLTVPGNYLL